MNSSTEISSDIKTFRGRSLEEVLPQIRAELGPDAVVLRRREGLAGGMGGFFQRTYVEVDARPALADEQPLEARNDRATAEGLASPAIQVLVEQASPFADALARAEGTVGARAHDVLVAAASGATDAAAAPSRPPVSVPVDAGLYGPQPNRDAIEHVADDLDPIPAAEQDTIFPGAATHVPATTRDAEPATSDARPGLGVPRPATADAAEKQLVAAGVSAGLAADIVGEAVAHGLPFAQPRALKKLIRSALARRMTVMSDLGPGPRTLAFVGAGGSGKSTATERLAANYAQADADVVVVALRAADGGAGLAARLAPFGVSVIAAQNADEAVRRLARRAGALTIVDTRAAGLSDHEAVAQLHADLRTLGVNEVHLTVPATISVAAADVLAAALAPVGITHVTLTHADETACPGAPVELAVIGRHALSYVCSSKAIEPVDAEALAKQLLP